MGFLIYLESIVLRYIPKSVWTVDKNKLLASDICFKRNTFNIYYLYKKIYVKVR